MKEVYDPCLDHMPERHKGEVRDPPRGYLNRHELENYLANQEEAGSDTHDTTMAYPPYHHQ